MSKNIILYDAFYTYGGAESVTLELSSIFENADICVDFNELASIDQAIDKNIISLSKSSKNRSLNLIKGYFNFSRKTQFLMHYNIAVFSGMYALTAVKFHIPGKNYYYCHTPPRFAFDMQSYFAENYPLYIRPFFKLFCSFIRKNYIANLKKMDIVYANSLNVQKRLKEFCDINSIVVPPPCNTNEFLWLSPGKYYLSTARLESYKRIRLIIDAFKNMPDKKLVITSGGSQFEELVAYAEKCSNIEFTNWQSHENIVKLFGNCIATIYIPIDEDFGISPIESMSAGKPVIGVAEGGLLETILDGQTGTFVPPDPNIEDLVKAVCSMDQEYAESLKDNCIQRAASFSKEHFRNKILSSIEELQHR